MKNLKVYTKIVEVKRYIDTKLTVVDTFIGFKCAVSDCGIKITSEARFSDGKIMQKLEDYLYHIENVWYPNYFNNIEVIYTI